MITADTFTPPGVTFEAEPHTYTCEGTPQLSVTEALRGVGLIDIAWCAEQARIRGSIVHAAIALLHDGELPIDRCPADVAPYVDGYRQFLHDAAFRVDAYEEILCDPALGVAGTLDLRGQFVARPFLAISDGAVVAASAWALRDSERIDVIDVKTGSIPSFVGYQTAGYVRLLPREVRPTVRRWCLNLTDDGHYRLIPLMNRSDEAVFLAAVTIAKAKRGWR